MENVQDSNFRYTFASVILLVGCSQPAPQQKLVSVNIVDVNSHFNSGKLNEEQICSVCNKGYFIAKEGDDPYKEGERIQMLGSDTCTDLIEVQANVQVTDYKRPISCTLEIDGVNSEGELSIVSYNGLNKFKEPREDMRRSANIKVCCSNNDGDEEKCADTTAPLAVYKR